MIKLSASTHPAGDDYLTYIKDLIQDGIDMVHCDVMDGEFVKNTALSVFDVMQINNSSTITLDVHLMVKNPEKYVKEYVNAGANILTVHYEAFDNEKLLINTLKQIKNHGLLCGLSLKPNTQISKITHLLEYIDLVLIMSVEPGESGQVFNQSSLDKIAELKAIIKEHNYHILIEVDGGVNLENKQSLIEAGADILVVGSALFNAKNKKEFILNFKK